MTTNTTQIPIDAMYFQCLISAHNDPRWRGVASRLSGLGVEVGREGGSPGTPGPIGTLGGGCEEEDPQGGGGNRLGGCPWVEEYRLHEGNKSENRSRATVLTIRGMSASLRKHPSLTQDGRKWVWVLATVTFEICDDTQPRCLEQEQPRLHPAMSRDIDGPVR